MIFTVRSVRQFVFCLALLCAGMTAANAATFTVTRTDDRNATCVSGTDCSLREAVAAANATTADDTINFAIPAANCTNGVCTITLTGELTILETAIGGALTITNTTGRTNLLVSGNNATRIFYMNDNANLTLNGLTVTAGNGTGQNSGIGGAIVASGVLTLNNLIVSNSVITAANGVGGGIFNFGTLNVTNSTISGNSASSGGGITSNGTALTITNSTISGNTATALRGGGVENFNGPLTATDSTFSGNMALNGGGGGGIYTLIDTNLTRVTVSGNTAANGGGIFNNVTNTLTMTNSTVSGNTAYGTNSVAGGIESDNANFTLTAVTVTNNSSTAANCTNCAGGIRHSTRTGILQNTIVAGNTVAAAASAPDYSGNITDTSSFNLIGNGDGITNGGITGGTNGNQVGTTANPINPMLGALANNGGATQTHALLTNSPAIDKGSSFGLTTDQRGSTRPQTPANPSPGDGADIGAYETQLQPTAADVSIGGRVLTPEGRGLMNARVILTDQNGATRSVTTSAFGYFNFTEVSAGKSVLIAINSKRYTFDAQAVFVSEDLTEINFVAQPLKRQEIGDAGKRFYTDGIFVAH